MRSLFLIAFMVAAQLAVGQNDPNAEIAKARAEKDVQFGDKTKSPLSKKEVRKFKGLKYFPIDSAYRVSAKFTLNGAPVLFKMPTTTTRLPEYLKYGELTFTLLDNQYTLEVYQNPEISKRPGYADYLFIPFTDETTGKETYPVGRYLEMRIPTGEDVVLDFNSCYNPWCAYSNTYSCPIPPEANHLPIAVRAGEKTFKEQH